MRSRESRVGRFEDWVNSPRVAGRLCLLVATGCLAGAGMSLADALALRGRGVETVAYVVGYTDRYRGPSHVTVEFETGDGRTVRADVGDFRWSPRPVVGDAVRVVYDPADPEGLVSDARIGPDFFDVWAFGAGSVAAAVAARLTFTGRIDWRRLAGRP